MPDFQLRPVLLLSSLALSCALTSACDKPAPEPTVTPTANPTETTESAEPTGYALGNPEVDAAALQAKVAQFQPVVLHADLSALPESERAALEELIAAARLLDPIFDRQVWAEYPTHAQRLADAAKAGGELEQLRYDYFQIMRGPWDRQDHFAPFAINIPHPPGAGFYPPGLTADEFRAFTAANPAMRDDLEGLFTLVVRDPNDPTQLRPVAYSEAFSEWLEPAAQKLEAAAALTKNASLATFLRSRAAAFRSDDYYQSDKDWMDLDSDVEITIGPYETYEDELLGLKASYEAFVTVSDPVASKKLGVYKDWLPKMEQNLPVPKEVKTKRGAESPIRVVDLVFTSGDARKSVQTIAFNLPNDERVRAEKGAKKVMLRNAINAKFDVIMKPIAERIMNPEQLPLLSQEAFFNEVLFHELSHSLGPAMVEVDGREVEVRVALGSSYSPLEEGKADVMGAWNVLFMIDKKQFPKTFRDQLLVTYFAGLFRSVRFGVAEAHGKGAAFQINRFLEDGAVSFDEKTGQFSVDTKKLEKSIESLVHDVVMLQHNGDKAAVDAFLAKYAVMSPPMEAALAKLDGIPVDIKPVYTNAGESAP
ncbi:dipeptidyl-peptidase 3 family protein [Enhygromyxa salina]|uniref:Peptidase family M49 n=1 Tax=Enhygromyxa salina TaxID=215803 RepID=A0A2S9XTT4_9BACT|nr:hypothetical protein [Enhygromyxa salina]PRP96121.1 Peptidase family M49 [Enhygromyxa salina]